MKYLIFISLSLLMSFQAQADLKCPGNVIFAQNAEADLDKNTTVPLVLNGVGLQKYIFFNLFYGALYVESPTSDNKTIMLPNEVKVVSVHALRDLPEKDLKKQWDNEYERLCEDQCDSLRRFHEQFLSYARDVDKNERINMLFFPDRLELEVPTGETFTPIESPEYGLIMLKSVIGDDPASKKLKEGMLGQDKKLCKEI